jgi:RHS repeat-associated protein
MEGAEPSPTSSPIWVPPDTPPWSEYSTEIKASIEPIEGVEIEALPLKVSTATEAPEPASRSSVALPGLQVLEERPEPGIQRNLARRSAGGAVQDVRPPEAPQAIVAERPDQYAGVAAHAEEIAPPATPRLSVRPAVLRFSLTETGTIPVRQTVEISSDWRTGARFEVTGSTDWLIIDPAPGRAGLRATSVRVAIDARRLTAPASGLLYVKNLEDFSDVQQIAVEVQAAEPGAHLRTHDGEGRLQRVVRPDGGVLDYHYDARGNLVRIRRPDGSAVTWTYDVQSRRIAMTDHRGTTAYRYDAEGRLNSVYTPGFDPVRYLYDESDRLTTLHLPAGRVVAYEYDDEDRLLAVRSDLGTTHYTYDSVSGRPSEQVRPNGVATRYGYDAGGRLTDVIHVDAAGDTLLAFSWDLDDQGRPVSVRRETRAGDGEVTYTDLAYDESGRLLTVASPGRVMSYEYDEEGRRARTLEVAGSETEVTDYVYDDRGRLMQVGAESFEYDAIGNLVTRRSPDRTVRYRWGFEGRLVGFTDGQREVSYILDGDGRRVAVTVDGLTTDLLQDASGWIGGVLAEADAEGDDVRTHVHGYDLLTIEGESGEGSYYLYDYPHRSAAALVSPTGEVEKTFDSDPFGSLRSTPDPTLPPYLFSGGTHDAISGLIHRDGGAYDPELGSLLPSGVDLEVSPDPAVSPATGDTAPPRGVFGKALADMLSVDVSLPADPRDEPTAGRSSGQDPPTQKESIDTTILQSNELPPRYERLSTLRARSSLASRYRLPSDADSKYRRGELTLRTKSSGTTPRLKLQPEYLPFAKTANGLLPASQTLDISSTDGSALSFTVAEDISWLTVDAAGGSAPATLTVTVDPSGLTEAGSPFLGDLVLTNSSDPTDVRRVRARLLVRSTGASVTLRSFDANGNLRRVVKPDGNIIDYEVDPMGRVTRVRYPDIGDVSYAYDGNGNRVSMTDHRGTTIYQYDPENRLIGVFTPLGENYIPVTYGYDNAGRMTRLATPDGRTVFYEYDSDGRMTRVTDGADVTTYTYNVVSGFLSEQTLPNSITTTYTYDGDGRLTDLLHKSPDGELLMGFHYTLNAFGQRTSITKETPEKTEVTSYTYDEVGQLVSVIYPDGKTENFTYDSLGNRSRRTVTENGNTVVEEYEYDYENKLLKAGNEVFQHDLNGNIIRRSSPEKSTTYAYDSRDLLTSVTSSSLTIFYEYDGSGARVARENNGVRRNYLNYVSGGLSQVLLEANGAWQVLDSYSYGLHRLSRRNQLGPKYYVSDGTNNAALVNPSGSIDRSYTYSAFGQPLSLETSEEFLFSREKYDADVSLVYLRARYYDPALGRFLGRDKYPGVLSNPQTLGSYLYSLNDPINLSDPSGLFLAVERGLYAEGGVLGAAGTVAVQQGLIANGLNPLDWRLVTTTTTGVGVGTPGGSVGGIITFTPGAKTAQDLSGDSKFFGGSGGEGLIVGGSISSGDHPSLSVTFGAGFDTPLSLAGGKARKTVVSDTRLGDIFSRAGDWFSELFGGSGSSSNAGTQAAPSFLFDGLDQRWQSQPQHFAGLDLGGVSLNKTADLLLSLQDITGVTYDEATGQIILLGEENVALPPLDMNHVAVATESVLAGQDPGVSIDPPIVNNQMSVRYEGLTEHTEFGDIMFEADRVLKILTLGKDNITGQSVSSSVPGYKNMLQRRLDSAQACVGAPTSTRMWFQPKEVRLVPSTDGNSMVFDEVSMELLYESKSGNKVVSDPQAAAFASHFTQNYDAFAAEWPILQELEQLGKVVAIVKWIEDNQIPVDLSFLDNFPIEFFSTPTTTPVITVQGTRNFGPLFCSLSLRGGVSYVVPNEYLPAEPGAGDLLDEALTERPSEETFRWTYQPSGGPDETTAVAQSLTRSRRDGNVRFQEVDLSEPLAGGSELALLRIYNSFLDKPGPLGPGWSVLPAELRFPVKKKRFTFGSANLSLDLHERIWVTERAAGREDAYDLIGIDSSNLPIYRRADAMHVLRELSDGTYQLTREEGSTATFRADGKPLALADRNENEIDLLYDSQEPDRLLSVAADDGRSIDLSYDAEGQLSQATGPGGRQVTYGYDAEGRLSSVTDFANRTRSYGYDADGRLASATDAEGRSIFAAGYDDYDRTPSRRLGAAAQFGLDFDLESGESTSVDPLGRTSRQLFERRQLASPSGIRNEVYRPTESEDPLGNRVSMTWADDAFGPRTVTDAQGATTELGWDNRGHLTSLLSPLNELTERFYDWRDRLVAVRDAEGLATGFGYDDRNNPTNVYHDIQLVLNEEGNLTSFNYDSNNVSTFTYDAEGNLSGAANPLGQETEVENNAKGQPTRVTSPAGVETTLGYDARSRLTSSQTGGRQVTYGYDAADQVTSVSTNAGTTSLVRDPQGRVTEMIDALTRSTHFSYDTDGNLTRVEDPLSGVADYTYDVLGNLLSADLPNGTSNAWEYDELGRPVAALTGLGPAEPGLALTVESLDFGTIPIGTSRDRVLDLFNQGTAALTVSGITTAPPFSVDISGPTTIPPAGSLQVTVTFTPTDQTQANGDLTITSDDPGTALQLVALTGAGARKVAGLEATPSQDGIQLSWSQFDPGAPPFGHFNIYRSLMPIPGDVTALAPFDSSLTSPTATGFLDKLAVPGTSYFYAVTPVYANGDENNDVDPAGPVAYFTAFGPLAPETDVATAPQNENRPALAYNSADDEYLVVYERSISLSDTDVYGQRLSVSGTPLGAAIAIATTSNRHERGPRVAYIQSSNNYVVIWEFDASGTEANYNLRTRAVSAEGGLGTVRDVANSSRQERRPEIVYGIANGEHFVTFEDFGSDGIVDLGLRRLNAAGALVSGLSYSLSNASGDLDVTQPHVSYSTALNNFMVAFEIDAATGPSDIRVWGVRIRPDLGLVDGFTFTLADGSVHDRNPFLSYDSSQDEYLLVWETDTTGDGTNLGVTSRKIRSDGARGFILFGLASEAQNPRAVYNPNLEDFVILWEEHGGEPTIRSRRVRFTLSTLQTKSPVVVSSGSESRAHPDIGTSLASNTFLAVWDQDAGSGNFDIKSRLLGTFAPTLQVTPGALSFTSTSTQQTVTITNGNPTGGPLQWTASPDDSSPWLAVQPGSGSTTSSVTLDVTVDSTGLAPDTYLGTVEIASNDGTLDVPVTLTVGNTPPDVPTVPRPADGAVDQASVSGGTDLTLAWAGSDADGDAVTWDVYLDTTSTTVTALDPTARIGQGLGSPTYQPSSLTFHTTYFWRVVASDARGESTEGPVWQFTTVAVPPPVLVPVAPDPTRELQPLLSWQEVAGAASYQLQAADNAEFSSTLIDASDITATSLTPGAPLPEGSLYWRVRSVDAADQAGPFSAPDSFVVDTTPPGVPGLVAIAPDPTNDAEPVFEWSSVSGAASYRLQVAGAGGFASPAVDTTVPTLSYQPGTGLPEGTIEWRVASLDEAGNQSAFSAADQFTLDLTSPPAIDGLTAERQETGVALTWQPLSDPPSDFQRFRIYRSQEAFTNVTGVSLLDESLTSPAAISFLDETATPGVAYWYAVTALDTAGNENREVTVAQVLANEPPNEPVLLAPTVGAVVLPSGEATVALSWSASDPEDDPLRFEIFLSSDRALVEGTPDLTAKIAGDLEAPLFAAPGLEYQNTYYWRVIVLDLAPDGEARSATFGPLWSFSLPAIPAPLLTPLAPDPTNQLRPTLTWESVPGAAAYEIEISTDPAFGSTVVQVEATETSFTPANDLPEGALHWRVRAVDSKGLPGAYSGVDDFVVDVTAPGVPVPTPVTPDPTSNRRPELGWGSVAGVMGYRVQVSTDTGFGSPLIDTTVAGSPFVPTTDLPEGPIHWRVASQDEAGNESAFSAADDFTVDATAPSVPTLVPVTPDPTSNRRPTLGWGSVADASSYRVQISTEAGFGTLLLDTTVAGSPFVPSTDLPEGSIHWRVASQDEAGNESAFSAADDFTIDATAPGVPVLDPVTPDPTSNRRPTLGWGSVADATSYRVQVSTEAGFGTPLLDTTIAGSPFVPSTDLPEGPIHWRVASQDEAGNESAFSAADDFTVDATAPGVPVLVPVTPDPTSNRRPTLGWGSVADASSYRVQVSTEAGFGALLLDTTIAGSPFVPSTDLPEGSIHWRVASQDEAGNESAFSAADDFTVDATAPGVPVLVPVTPDPTSNRRPALAWGSVADASSYRVQVSTEAGFGALLLDTTIAGSPFVPSTDLPEGPIHWRVASQDAAGNESAFSAADEFQVDATAPDVPVLVPVSPDPTNNRRSSLGWGSVAGATGYRVQVSTEMGFGTLVLDTTAAASPFVPSTDLPEGTIHWRVASQDEAGNESAFSAADDFTVDATAPGVPVLVQVTPDPTSDRRPAFGWGSVADATSYRVQVSAEAGFAAPLLDTTVSGSPFMSGTDLPEGTIYWRVASQDEAGNESTFAAADEFQIDATAPEVPVVVPVSPDPTSNRRPALGWGSVADATSYRVQVSTEASFAAVLLDTSVAASPFVPSTDLPEGTIHWRVASQDAAGNESSFSAVDDFQVDATAPEVPTLVPVSPDPTSNRRPALAWGSVADATSYRVQVSTEVGFGTPLIDATVSSSPFVPSADLPEGSVHWRVASQDSLGNESSFSSPDSFVVDLSPIPAVTGLRVEWNASGTWELRWNSTDVPALDFWQFEIYRETTSFDSILQLSPLTTLANREATRFIDDSWQAAENYFYAVVPVDVAGNKVTAVAPILAPNSQLVLADDFEEGDLAAWSSAHAMSPAGLTVSGVAAHAGDFGLTVDAQSTCASADSEVLEGQSIVGNAEFVACETLTARDDFVVSSTGAVTLTAGERVVFGDGFRVESGGSLVAGVDPSLVRRAYVQDDSPESATGLKSQFYVNFDDLDLSEGDEFVHWGAFASQENPIPQVEIVVQQGAAGLVVWLAVRLDDGTEAKSAALPIPAGWNKINIDWMAAANGSASLTINDQSTGVLAPLDTEDGRIDLVHWGVVRGDLSSNPGVIHQDEFSSWQPAEM